MTHRALVLGAKSVIAQAVAQLLATEEGYDLILGARGSDQLAPFAADLALHTGRKVDLLEYDALRTGSAAAWPQRAVEAGGEFDLVVMAVGCLGDQSQAEADADELLRVLTTNYVGVALTLAGLAQYLAQRTDGGGIIGIASVAADRGRQSNYAYGSAKGGLALFLQGLRNRLARRGVHVLTVKPGFVDTPMTQGLEGLFLVASPERVARDIIRAYKRGRDVLYTPWFWRYIMLVIRCIPERVFKRLSL
jgi:decaprenylphospho-beta-D-erythro-pentofuranosid-2-ulose 2-reductase